jgi:hypothetical protein
MVIKSDMAAGDEYKNVLNIMHEGEAGLSSSPFSDTDIIICYQNTTFVKKHHKPFHPTHFVLIFQYGFAEP